MNPSAKKPPAHKAPTCDDLFDRYFKVRMLYLHSRSTEDVRRFGIRISGIEEYDKNRDKETILTEMSVNMMFEKHRNGVTINLVRYEDAAEVYKIIQNHILTWAEYLSHGVNTGNAPVKDLIELDMFAGVVYDKAINVFTEQERNTAVSSNFLGVQSINFTNILKRAPKETEGSFTRNGVEVTRVTEDNPNGLKERSSYKELFGSHIRNVASWNKT